jgi:hypothetical protein
MLASDAYYATGQGKGEDDDSLAIWYRLVPKRV